MKKFVFCICILVYQPGFAMDCRIVGSKVFSLLSVDKILDGRNLNKIKKTKEMSLEEGMILLNKMKDRRRSELSNEQFEIVKMFFAKRIYGDTSEPSMILHEWIHESNFLTETQFGELKDLVISGFIFAGEHVYSMYVGGWGSDKYLRSFRLADPKVKFVGINGMDSEVKGVAYGPDGLRYLLQNYSSYMTKEEIDTAIKNTSLVRVELDTVRRYRMPAIVKKFQKGS